MHCHVDVPTLCGLALEKLQYNPPKTLAALSRLRTLALRDKTGSRQMLPTKLLPASLEAVTVTRDDPLGNPDHVPGHPPLLVALNKLRQLRQLTFGGYPEWPLRSLPGRREQPMHRLRLPSSREVCTAVPAQPLARGEGIRPEWVWAH